MIPIDNSYYLQYIINMNYFQLPYGAQLLIWTSRVEFYGSCRTKPNKVELIEEAYNKAGIYNGNSLLRPFLKFLKSNDSFELQAICSRSINQSEIDLINCIDTYKTCSEVGNQFIEMWSLFQEENSFSSCAKKLAGAFKRVNLETKLSFSNIQIPRNNYISSSLH